jgi:hypothetical protein
MSQRVKIETIQLSSLQYGMLKAWTARKGDYYMKRSQATLYDQRPFRSMLIRQYVEYDPKVDGFRLTPKGRSAMIDFETRDVLRHFESSKLTSYFHLPKQTNSKAVKEVRESA